ncbi:ribose-phosphate diphosphokinase [Candidatus Vidania fulgoroideae]|nr:ribose-phosphate diphosphokinase [Candidatus Vidania fulgoroideae]WDR79285.1 ribose-phosphate diphosphokinase [Candidatus Vidania fulgoroideae]
MIILNNLKKNKYLKKNNKIKIKYFPDGELKIKTKLKNNIKKVFLIFLINKNIEKEIFKILMIIDNFKKNGINKIYLLIPYLRFSRQDKFKNSSPLKLFIKMLEKVKLKMLVTFDIHSIQTLGFSEKLIIRNFSLFPKIIKILKDIKKKIIFTDIGGYNRYSKYLKNENYFVFNKFREKKNVKILNKNIVKENIKYIIFDDIIDSGKTIIESIKKLKNSNIKNIYIFSIHPVFSNKKFFKTIKKIKEIKKIFIFKTLKKKIKSKKIFFLRIKRKINSIIKKCLKK